MNYKVIWNLSYFLEKHDREWTSRISSQKLPAMRKKVTIIMLLGKIWMFKLAQHYLTLFDQKLNSVSIHPVLHQCHQTV